MALAAAPALHPPAPQVAAFAGLVLGLLAFPPTAWFAVFELGIPAAITGGVLGLAAGSVVLAVRRLGGTGRRLWP